MTETKKWQNLVSRQCPKCDKALRAQARKARLVFECPDEECNFVITGSSYVRILADKRHILRRYLSKEETDALEKALSVESLSTNQKTL